MLYRNMYVLYIQYIYTLQVCIFTTCSIVIHFIGCSSQSPNLEKFILEFCVWFPKFRFARIFQGCNFGVKWDLPVQYQSLNHIYVSLTFKWSNRNLRFIMKSSNNYNLDVLIFHFGFERNCCVILYQILTVEKLTNLNVYVYHILV